MVFCCIRCAVARNAADWGRQDVQLRIVTNLSLSFKTARAVRGVAQPFSSVSPSLSPGMQLKTHAVPHVLCAMIYDTAYHTLLSSVFRTPLRCAMY